MRWQFNTNSTANHRVLDCQPMSLLPPFDDDEVRYFSFNKIYVIETLNENEKQTGKELYDDLLRRSTYRHGWFDSSHEFAYNKKQLFNALTRIKYDAMGGKIFPFIHIEGHGNPTGLQIGKGKTRGIVKWEDLALEFQKINVATKNNLMLSVATCFGCNIYKGISISERSPFFGFIAPLEEVSFGEIADGYNAFFDRIINTTEFDDAVLTLRDAFDGRAPRFTYVHCETLFRRVADNMLEAWRDPIEGKKSLLELITRSLSNVHVRLRYSIPQIVDNSAYALSQREVWLKRWHDNFLMKDL